MWQSGNLISFDSLEFHVCKGDIALVIDIDAIEIFSCDWNKCALHVIVLISEHRGAIPSPPETSGTHSKKSEESNSVIAMTATKRNEGWNEGYQKQ